MMRRSFLMEKDLSYDESFPGCMIMNCGAGLSLQKFSIYPRYLTYYRRSPGQISMDPSGFRETMLFGYTATVTDAGIPPTEEEMDCHLRLVVCWNLKRRTKM